MNNDDDAVSDKDTQPFAHLISNCIQPNGFGSLSKRKRLWPLINKIRPYDYLQICSIEREIFQENKNSRIVYMDCERYNHYLNNDFVDDDNNINSSDEGISNGLNSFSNKLYEMIMRVLCNNKNLVYYQGFHDIATVLLLVLGQNHGTVLLNLFTRTQLRDFMGQDLTHTTKYLDFVIKLIEINDNELYNFMIKSNVGSVFCLSWLLTWYSHNVKSFSLACRLFDLFMVTNKYMPAYLASILVMGLRDEILSLNCDMATVHCFLGHIPELITNDSWEKSIESALTLFDRYPPNVIITYKSGFFRYRTLLLFSSWKTKKLNKTLLKNSILNGKAKFIRKGFKRNHHLLKNSICNYYFDVNHAIIGVTTLFVAIGTYFIYQYFVE